MALERNLPMIFCLTSINPYYVLNHILILTGKCGYQPSSKRPLSAENGDHPLPWVQFPFIEKVLLETYSSPGSL